MTGCRIGELAKTPKDNLRDGRLYFEAVTTKGRKQRAVKLPPAIYEELKKRCGPTFVFERFADGLRAFHQKRGKTRTPRWSRVHSSPVGEWLEEQTKEYSRHNPKAKKFKLHNFRGTAMSRAQEDEGGHRGCRHRLRL